MILYTIYKDKKKDILPEFKLQDVPNGTTENGKTEKTETLNETKDSTVKEGIVGASIEPSESSMCERV